MFRPTKILALVCAATIAGCGGGGSSGGYSTSPTTPTTPTNPGTNPPAGGASNTVTLSESTFQPGTLTVVKGTTVTWKWAACVDGGYGGYASCVSHSVTFDDGSNIASPTQTEGTFTRTFATAGTFKYHCAVHGTSMSGQVTVQ